MMRTKKTQRQQQKHEDKILAEINDNANKRAKKKDGMIKVKSKTKTPKDRHPLQTARLMDKT